MLAQRIVQEAQVKREPSIAQEDFSNELNPKTKTKVLVVPVAHCCIFYDIHIFSESDS